jgi:NAD-dependent dihydropyrimidine dehydrogenase PreA subunit
MMPETKTILICRCSERGLLKPHRIDEASCLVVSDLCLAAQDKSPVFEQVAASRQPVIYACHPRAVKALFESAGHPLPENTEFHNLRSPSVQPSTLPSFHSSSLPAFQSSTLPDSHTPTLPHAHTPSLPNSLPAWFPVIDRDRCSNCGQCFQFCLFGVYEKDPAGRVRVVSPQSCKNNCPACARICPEAAIIFPKAGEEPINGAEISSEEALRANIKLNVDELLGDDVYAALNARKQKRRALLNKKKVEQALAERNRCSGGGQ